MKLKCDLFAMDEVDWLYKQKKGRKKIKIMLLWEENEEEEKKIPRLEVEVENMSQKTPFRTSQNFPIQKKITTNFNRDENFSK